MNFCTVGNVLVLISGDDNDNDGNDDNDDGSSDGKN